MKKIIAIVAVIVAITACLCIGASAYQAGETIPKGTVIEFKEPLTFVSNTGFITEIYFESNGVNYEAIQVQNYNIKYKDTVDQTYNEAQTAYNGSTDLWTKGNNIIKLREDYTVISNPQAVGLFSNTNIVKITPPILNKTINETKATFATTLTVATAIIAWLMANQLALVGLYMYILITLVLIGKRYIKGV